MLVDGELELGMIWKSKKALDLLRDPRCHLHSWSPTATAPRASSSCGAPPASCGLAERERYCVALHPKIGWRPNEPFHAFAIDLESAAYRRFGEGDKVYALVWKAGGETRESEQVLEV